MNSIDNKCVNTLRVLGAEIISSVNSGHPGIVLGAAPIIYTLYAYFLLLYVHKLHKEQKFT